MEELLKDWGDYIAGGLFVGVGFAIWYFFQRKRLILSYEVESISTIIDSNNFKNEEILVLYRHIEISYLEVWNIRIINSGNTAIKNTLMAIPITISYESSTLIQYRVYDDLNNNLELSITPLSDNQLKIEFKLLNSKDSFNVELFFTEKQNIRIECKIEGGNKIGESLKNESRFIYEISKFGMVFIVIMILFRLIRHIMSPSLPFLLNLSNLNYNGMGFFTFLFVLILFAIYTVITWNIYKKYSNHSFNNRIKK